MATHDYVIDNQTAPNFRADLNNALLAIVSNNSSATAPAVTYANMMWYDTAANILYMRNEDNDAWIRLGTLDQTADTFAAAVSLASQAEAETGTDNTKVMTPLRVKQSVAVNPPSTAQVLTATAGATDGSIGTYALLGSPTSRSIVAGDTYAGSGLVFAGTRSTNTFNDNTAADITSGTTLSGTWRAMGRGSAGSGRLTMTLFLRIS
jgi:hypothetical protein